MGKRKQTKKFKELMCSPSRKNKKDYSCYNDNTLKKMRKRWNRTHKKDKIESNRSKDIWVELNKNLRKVCNKESCWLEQDFMNGVDKDEIKRKTWAPQHPETWKDNPNTWLNSLDIEGVMKQYEDTYKDFKFIGPSPIDFDTIMEENNSDNYKGKKQAVWPELKNLNINKQKKKGINKIGIIFNLDPHTKGGSHWVAMYIDIKKSKIYYFDSNGIDAPKQVKALVKRIKAQGRAIGKNFSYEHNSFEHQMEDTECGIYTLYFIINMLKGRNFSYFKQNRIADETMMKLRKKYFNQQL